MDLIAYEMEYTDTIIEECNINCIKFEEKYFNDYMRIYNECFYNMRKALDRKPYNFLSDYKQIANHINNIYLLIENNQIIGSVACYGNEVDDLIVNKKYQNKGYGKKLLLWAMHVIRKNNYNPITLHVAKWNENALKLYQNVGFAIKGTEIIG